MRNAFLFPGQGSQSVGMGMELYRHLPAAKSILDTACEVLGYDLKKLMSDGPIEKLTDTKYAQPAIYACSAMYLEKAKEQGIAYEYVAGHSLGEYSALYAAGVFRFEEGLRLVDRRARAMAEENQKGIMAAVMGLTEEELKPYIDRRTDVVMANLNTKTQIVVSGTKTGIADIMDELSAKEEVQVRKLAVSAAFHSPQMKEAAKIMRCEIESMEFQRPSAFVVSNVTGKVAGNAEEIRENLIVQITGQVRWADGILTMKEAGVDQFYECGNGKVLRKMNKAITLRPKCMGIGE